MPILTGAVTLNGVLDAQLIKVLQAKEKGSFAFNPQAMQSAQVNEGGKIHTVYNNVQLVWSSGDNLKGVRDLLNEFIGNQ